MTCAPAVSFVFGILTVGATTATTVAQQPRGGGSDGPRVSIMEIAAGRRVLIDGGLFTEYRHDGHLAKMPILYPLIGPDGVRMTRDFPMKKETEGEAHDHPHHRSVWFAHGQVNGHDFWHGTGSGDVVVHERYLPIEAKELEGRAIRTKNRWVGRDSEIVATETRELVFGVRADDTRTIDMTVVVHASHGAVKFGDTKEGTMALRLNPALRLKGKVAKGAIVNSEGQRDGAAWGKRAAWVAYWGPVAGEQVGVALLDHPGNLRHPCWWHARDYGLLAANPFGAHAFEKAARGAGDYELPAGEDLVFRYRLLLFRGSPDDAKVADHFASYAGRGTAWKMPTDARSLLPAFVFSDDSAWSAISGDSQAWLELVGKSEYRPPHRSPLNIALVDGAAFGDFVLDAELMQTGRDYGHRDLCLFFGWQSPARYYYVHLASEADPHAHNVFLVADAARKAIATKTTKGIDWGREVWRKVRLERRVADGLVRVYFDDMTTPIMEASDTTFGAGLVGFGSFDDTGRIRNLRIEGARAAAPRETFGR